MVMEGLAFEMGREFLIGRNGIEGLEVFEIGRDFSPGINGATIKLGFSPWDMLFADSAERRLFRN